MKSIDKLREWANGLHGVYINQIDHTITVTTGWDTPPDMDSVSLCDHINGILDGIEREVDDMWHALTIDAKPMTDENMAESGWVRLPVDAEGEYIHIGDVMETDNGIREVDVLQKSSRKWSIGLVPVGGGAFSWHDAETLHHHAPTVEDVLEQFLTAYDDADEGQLGITTRDVIAEYAAKLRLAEDNSSLYEWERDE